MPFKGTNIEAYKRAKRGKTKKERSKIYYQEKKKLENPFSFFEWIKKLLNESNEEQTNVIKKKETNTFPVPKMKTRETQTKYVPRKLILDEIREYRSSKMISHVSDSIATFFVKMSCKNMSNNQKNILRSTIAFIASETFNKALEKPLRVIDNVKMFIKVSKIVYKIVLYFDKKLNEYCVDEDNITIVRNNDLEYLEYLDKHPTIKQLEKKIAILDYLGKEVFVKIDRPLGSVHPEHAGFVYPVNYGYLPNIYTLDGEKQNAYVLGINEPIKEYKGIVKAIIIRKNDIEDKLVVCPSESEFSKEQIKALISFQEKFFEIEIVK